MARKDKVARSNAKRQEKHNYERTAIKPQTPTVEVQPELDAPESIEMHRMRETPIPAVTPVVAGSMNAAPVNKATTTNEGVITPVAGLTQVSTVTSGAPSNPAVKPLTISDLLASQREAAVKDKTDAGRMQQYYALADVFNALGKMGGAVVGGAVGGNILDSAPMVGEYKESRGYLDAFERAKQANERLRALDDKAFTLAYNKQEKADERAYKEQALKIENDYRKQLADYEHKLKQAQAQKNHDLEKSLQESIANLKHEHEMAQIKLKGDYAIGEKNLSKEIVAMQMGGAGIDPSSLGKTITPVIFKDKSMQYIPNYALDAIRTALMGTVVGEGENAIEVDKDNVDSIIRDNPEMINEYLIQLGLMERPKPKHELGGQIVTRYGNAVFPQHITQVPTEFMSNRNNGVGLSAEDLDAKWGGN